MAGNDTRYFTLTALIAGVAATVLVFVGCNTGSDFDEFSGVNLIASQNFESNEWSFADGLLTGTTDPVTGEVAAIDHVAFTATAESGPTGVTDTVYRLEVRNLLPNGDFEDGTLVHNGTPWVEGTTDGSVASANAALAGTPIAGTQSLELAFDSSLVYYALDLTGALLDGFISDASYSFRFLTNTNREEFNMEMNNASGAGDASDADTQNQFSVVIPLSLEDTTTRVPIVGESGAVPTINTQNEITANASFVNLSFGGYFTQVASIAGRFDNIGIVRSDKNYYLRLPVTLGATGRPNLASAGSYTVSVWVKEDPTTSFTPSHVSLGIDNTPDGPGGEFATEIELTGDLTQWQEVSTSFNGFSFDAVGAVDSTVILEVLIEIGASEGDSILTEPGSLLVAGPGLEWSSDTL